MSNVYIVSAKRTPIGKLRGKLSSITAPMLGGVALRSAITHGGVAPDSIDEVIMGNVLTAGVGQAPARQAAMMAGIPLSTGATTVNKVCGSGMKAIMLGNDIIKSGTARIVAAGGMESMSNAPHLAQIRSGVKLGPAEMYDHLLRDGINNADGRSLGLFSEECAAKYGFTRNIQDEYSMESARRAKAAQESGAYAAEITPVMVEKESGAELVETDEIPQSIEISNIPKLAPSFKIDGTITPATASGFCDGAAALILASEEAVKSNHLVPLARVVAHATHSHEPEWFSTAPVGAIRKVLVKAGWNVDEVDLFEVNEAMAVVPMAAMHDLEIPHDKMNINGGACSLGHPIGASGARIVAALLHALIAHDKKTGVASLCIGGGEGTALAIERV